MKILKYVAYDPQRFYIITGKLNIQDTNFAFALIIQHLSTDHRGWKDCIMLKEAHYKKDLDSEVMECITKDKSFCNDDTGYAHQYADWSKYGDEFQVETYELVDTIEAIDQVAKDLLKNNKNKTINEIHDKYANTKKHLSYEHNMKYHVERMLRTDETYTI